MWVNLQSQYDLRMAQRTTLPKIRSRINARGETVAAMAELEAGGGEVSTGSTREAFDKAVGKRRT
ncbi:MAG: hypothetical protein WAN86_07240 [Hyphomicrobiaceae bacterium]